MTLAAERLTTNSVRFEPVLVIADSVDWPSVGNAALRLSIPAAPVDTDTHRENPSTNLLPESITANWTLFADAALPISLASRLLMLANLADGWGEGAGQKLTGLSVTAFLRFWKGASASAPTTPFLTLTYSGHLQAEWHASWRRHLQIEFISTEKTLVGLVEGNDQWTGKASVFGALEACNRSGQPLRWKPR